MSSKTLYVILFFLYLPFNCTMPEEHKDAKIVEQKAPIYRDAFHQLCQYWEVTDAENPTYRDVNDSHTQGIDDYAGIIFMTDSTFLENPKGQMRYGKFTYKGKSIEAIFDDGKKDEYIINSIRGNNMVVKRTEKNHTTTLQLKGAQIFWPDASSNPFNKINSLWRIKPVKVESNDELNKRLKGCVQFYEYFFQGYAKSTSTEVDFLGLPTCFKWYQGAIYVQGPKNLDKKWINCFYSEDQAMQARQIMEDVVTKKYDWDTTQRNWLQQTADVLKQIHAKM
jgi:hypothetical protein